MNLTAQLKKQKETFKQKAPQEIQKSMEEAHKELIKRDIAKNALKLSDYFPNFELRNHNNKNISLSSILETGDYHIISFYRGGWCPYCNLELKSLHDNISIFKELNTTLTAITPETPDNSLSTFNKNNLAFDILTDNNGTVAKSVGIAFTLPEVLKPIYKEFGIDISKHNGDEEYQLPVPATFILNNKGQIVYEYIELDYTQRLDPEILINFLKSKNQ